MSYCILNLGQQGVCAIRQCRAVSVAVGLSREPFMVGIGKLVGLAGFLGEDVFVVVIRQHTEHAGGGLEVFAEAGEGVGASVASFDDDVVEAVYLIAHLIAQ